MFEPFFSKPWMHRTLVSWGKEEILQLRAMELKHGRVAMLAVLGWFHVAAGYHIVGDYAVGEHLDNNPLVNLTQMPMGGIWQVVFTIMCLEWVTTYVSRSEIWCDMWGRCSTLGNPALSCIGVSADLPHDRIGFPWIFLHFPSTSPWVSCRFASPQLRSLGTSWAGATSSLRCSKGIGLGAGV